MVIKIPTLLTAMVAMVLSCITPGLNAATLDRSNWTLSSNINDVALSNAIDDNQDSRWTTRQVQQPDQYIQIDLGSLQSFDQIRLDSSNSPDDQPNRYDVYISTTEDVFGTVIASGNGSQDGLTLISFDSVTARYVRIVQTGNTIRNWWSIHEINIYNNQLDPSTWVLSASINNAELSHAIDGNENTRWTTTRQVQQAGQYFQVDLGTSQSFNQILLDSTNSRGDQPNSYEVYASNNENDLGNTVASGNGSENGITHITFPSVHARYLRIVQTGSTTRNWWSIHTINIFSTQTSSSLPESFTHVVTYNDESVTLNLHKFSSRGSLFSVFTQDANGNVIEAENVDENRAYIGLVEDHPDAFAAASIRADGTILATVIFPNKMTWRDQGGDVSALTSDFTPSEPPTLFLTEKAGSDVYAADVFVDLPYSYLEETEGDIAKALESLEYNFALINATFMRDVSVFHHLGKIVMRTELSQDPYAGINSRAELSPTFINQDLSQLEVTNGEHDVGAIISPQAAGATGLGAIRNGRAFMVVGTRLNGNGYFIADGRHELGHIWGSNHNEGGAQIEGPTILETGNNNPLGKFAAPSIRAILPIRDIAFNAGHIDNLGNIAPPLPPRAADDVITLSLNSSKTLDPLLNDNDVNNNAITIISAQSITNAGNLVTIENNRIRIESVAEAVNGYDWFRYTIEDSSGLTATAVVHILMGAETEDTLANTLTGSALTINPTIESEFVLTQDHINCDH